MKKTCRLFLHSLKFAFVAQIIFVFFIPLYLGCVKAEEGVIFGENNLEKKLFFESSSLTAITKITFMNQSLFVFGQRSLNVVDLATKKMKAEVNFDWPSGIIRPDIYNEGKSYVIVSKGPVSEIGAMDSHGNKIWTFSPDPTVIASTMAFGDINQNNLIEYYVSTNKGLFKLDDKGEKVWKKGDEVTDVEIIESDEEPFVVSVKHDSIIEYRDFNGTLKKKINPGIRLFDIEPINWPSKGSILTYDRSKIYIFNNIGKKVFSHDIGKNIYMIKAAPVVFEDTKDPYIAILAKLSSSSGKAMLCIFTFEGTLFYKELIGVSQGIVAVAEKGIEKEYLLVGDGVGKVYKYKRR